MSEEGKTPIVVNPWVLPENSNASGVITFYHNRRKWGRISQNKDEGSPSIFFHLSAFKADASSKIKVSPKEGYTVTFTAVKTEDERLKASDVELSADAKADQQARFEAREAKRAVASEGAKAKSEAAPAPAAAAKKAPKEKKPAAAAANATEKPKKEGNKRGKVVAKEEKAQSPRVKKEKNTNNSASAEGEESKEGPQLTVNATLVGTFEGAQSNATISVSLKAGRFLSLLKRKACKKLNLKTSDGLEMFLENNGVFESVKYEDFKKFKDGDSCNVQIRASSA